MLVDSEKWCGRRTTQHKMLQYQGKKWQQQNLFKSLTQGLAHKCVSVFTGVNNCVYLFSRTSFQSVNGYLTARDIPIQEGRGLSQALLSPVMHFSVEAPCRVYPGSHLYVMLLPEKWPWSLTLKPNWGTPGSSQWDNSKPGNKKKEKDL